MKNSKNGLFVADPNINIFLFLFACLFSSFAFASSHLVKMNSISYEPRKLEIKIGDSVQWQNGAYTEHSATAEDAATLDTGLIAPQKKSKVILFSKVGNYKYHCSLHGKTMNGEVNVTK
ncbi:MAG: cupredoxin domain-containing protein [Bdellovibrionaceae bacterium]|nr:cupredoxin domain-containing protein [Pseudobdellovibrionaceae bacterium]